MSVKTIIRQLGIVLLVFGLAGCGSLDRVKPQALQPSDRDLSSIKNNLVFFAVNIHQRRPTLKLRGMTAKHTGTGELYSFAFFHNVILRSSELPHVIRGNTVEQLVILDLPKGTYAITGFDFFNIYRAAKLSTLKQKVTRPLLFNVAGGQPSYLGRLDLQIGRSTVTRSQDNFASTMAQSFAERDARRARTRGILPGPPNEGMPRAAMEAMSRKVETLSGAVTINISAPQSIDIQRARSRYPALANRQISTGRIWSGR